MLYEKQRKERGNDKLRHLLEKVEQFQMKQVLGMLEENALLQKKILEKQNENSKLFLTQYYKLRYKTDEQNKILEKQNEDLKLFLTQHYKLRYKTDGTNENSSSLKSEFEKKNFN